MVTTCVGWSSRSGGRISAVSTVWGGHLGSVPRRPHVAQGSQATGNTEERERETIKPARVSPATPNEQYCGGSRTGGSLPRPEDKTQPPRSSLPRAARPKPPSLFSSGKARRSGKSTRRCSLLPRNREDGERACREMPPIRLKLRDLPRLPDGVGDDNNPGAQRSSAGMAVGAGIAARTTEHLSDAWRSWPATALGSAQLALKSWLARMDAALLVLPKGLGPALSSLVRHSIIRNSRVATCCICSCASSS